LQGFSPPSIALIWGGIIKSFVKYGFRYCCYFWKSTYVELEDLRPKP
jgi:hypothetical protein